jgi:hypothetical protein
MDTIRTARVTHAGETREATPETAVAVLGEMIATSGQTFDPATSKIEIVETVQSPFTVKEGEVDPRAAERVTAQQDVIREAGFDVGDQHQFFKTGTRMLDIGHQTMAGEKRAHDQLRPLAAVLDEIDQTIAAEKRHQRRVTSGEIGRLLSVNGKLKVDGYAIQEQALRNLLARLDSPALGMVLGMRERLAGRSKLGALTAEGKQLDKGMLLEIVQHECKMNPDVDLVLRLRDGSGDCFTIVTPEYTVADAPSITPQIRAALAGDTRATWTYNPISTVWEIKAETFTPTPTQEMAVGEPFKAYSSISGGDGGITALWGGGGFVLIRCWNATTYLAEQDGSRKIHRGNVRGNIVQLVRGSLHAIETAIKAWGIARETVIPAEVHDGGKLVSIESVIPGYYRHMLTARRGELVGVLPGRTETHVGQLAKTFDSERRNRADITRADLANGYTRYIQDQPIEVRRTAEAAIGSWLVNGEAVKYAAPARS